MRKTLSDPMPINMAKLLQGLRWLLMPILLIALVQNLGPMPTDRNDPNHTAEAIRSVVVWRGGTGNLKWSDPANWAGGHVPGPSDFVRLSKGSTPDAVVDPAFGGVIAGLTIEDNYDGTVTLARDLTVHGEMTLSDGVFEQGTNVLTAHSYTQTGGALLGGSADMMIDGPATVAAGTLTTPHGTLTVDSLTINAPGIVIMAANGKLNLTGSGTPLMGTGQLDTTTHRPNSVEYTGQGTTDITAAGPASAYHNLPLAPQDFSQYATLTFNSRESDLSSAIIDRVAGFAYFGTGDSPGIVVKVRLSDFTRVGALILGTNEGHLRAAVIDPAAGFAYFGTKMTSPGKVVKVRLSDFTRVGALILNGGEDSLFSAVIDPAAGFAYFGTGDESSFPPYQNTVVKIRLSDFTRVEALTLDSNGGAPTSAVIDPVAGFAYFGTNSWPSHIVKVRLSNFTLAGVLTLNADECASSSAVIDSIAGFAYFGTARCTEDYIPPFPVATGKIVKVRLSDLAHMGAIDLSGTVGEGGLISAVIDQAAGFAYFGSSIWFGKSGVIKVRLSNFTRSDILILNTGETDLASAVVDPIAGFAYFGADTSPSAGKVVKVRLSNFSRVDALTLNVHEGYLYSAVIDPTAGFAYFGTGTDQVMKVRLSDFSRVGALTLDANGNTLVSAVIDPANGFAYFGTSGWPGKVVKVRLSDFTHVGTLTLDTDENSVACAVIDPAAGFAYFGTGTDPGKVVKVRLSDFTRVGALALDANENSLVSAIIDSVAGFAYFATYPGKVVKVRLSDFTRVDVLTLTEGLSSAEIDLIAGFAYFGTDTAPGKVVKVRLSDFTSVDTLTFNVGESYLYSAVIDSVAGLAYFGASFYWDAHLAAVIPAKVVKVRLSDLTRVAAQTLDPGDYGLTSAVIDPVAGFAYFGTDTVPGKVIKVSIASRADLSISKTDGQATALPGDATTYLITIINHGPDQVTSAMVTDIFPATLTGVSWMCSASAGSSCAISGLHGGNISTTVNLAVSGTAILLASGTVSGKLDVLLSNTVTVTTRPGTIDSNPDNNSATDADWIGTTWPFSYYLPLVFR